MNKIVKTEAGNLNAELRYLSYKNDNRKNLEKAENTNSEDKYSSFNERNRENIAKGTNYTSEHQYSSSDKNEEESITEVVNSNSELQYSSSDKGQLLSSFFYGYAISPFISGLILHKFGIKRVVFIAMLVNAVLTLLTPTLLRYSVVLTVILRSMIGVLSGIPMLAGQCIWTLWAPQVEKTSLIFWTNTGTSTGNIISSFATGKLCSEF